MSATISGLVRKTLAGSSALVLCVACHGETTSQNSSDHPSKTPAPASKPAAANPAPAAPTTAAPAPSATAAPAPAQTHMTSTYQGRDDVEMANAGAGGSSHSGHHKGDGAGGGSSSHGHKGAGGGSHNE